MTDAETARNWTIVAGPVGPEWSGRARYAAAMHFYQQGAMSAEVLEIYRICSRIDDEDPLEALARYGIGADWIHKVRDHRRNLSARTQAPSP